ncbi:TlpA disulfide reductase family protein [Flavobacteriaceae bacterium 14752]|uniref:TlpA disulfide reductase family protein n=1 Tax=Mesohalobacter salilacus TaxID=2491711 RepID=UPI000F62EDEE|nr:AhpC/TSA family protein [Flavobacteriaceae bacterium 14752]
MKGLVLSVFSILIFIACQSDKADFTAQIDGVDNNAKVYLSKLGKNNQPVPIDTVEVMNGQFTLDLEEGEPQQLNMFTIEGVSSNLFFVNEDEPLEAVLYKDSLRSSRISGGKHNELLMTYMDTLKASANAMNKLGQDMRQAMMDQNRETYMSLRKEQEALQDQDVAFRKEMAESNPNSIVAALALSDLMSSKKLPNSEIKSIYNSFSDEVKDHTLGKLLAQNIAKMSKTDIGAKVEMFEAPTPEGDMLSLKDAMGELTLIDFWASWCKPCRIENPNVVSVYNDYKDKGFSIISVSLDKKKSSWKKAIKDDNMDWYHISNLQYWNEPIAKEWGVRSIPATFLIDESGVIVAKNLRGNALRQKVDEILGEG